jgi:hypothetical protein
MLRRGLLLKNAAAAAAAGGSAAANDARDRKAFIKALMEKDEEVLNLKRLHELSILRSSENQRRKIDDYHERGILFEDHNVRDYVLGVDQHQADTKNVRKHSKLRDRLRLAKLAVHGGITAACTLWLTWRYMWNPQRHYQKEPQIIWGNEFYGQPKPRGPGQ